MTKTLNKASKTNNYDVTLNGSKKLVVFYNDRYMNLESLWHIVPVDQDTEALPKPEKSEINLMDCTGDKHEIVLDQDFGINLRRIINDIVSEFNDVELDKALTNNDLNYIIDYIERD